MHLWYIILLTFSCCLWGHPSGMEAVKGSCNLQKVGRNLQVGASDGAVLHWEDFSIALGEHVEFIQPSAKAWVLNKVTGKERSEIYGGLTSNGQIVLINQNGILFGKDSRVEVGGIIASSLKDVIVEGSISAANGALALLGKEVHISGEVLSRVGKHAYVRVEDNPYGIEITKAGGRVYVHGEEKAIVTEGGMICGENVYLLSDGVTHFYGKASVGDIEISGRNGFYHQGEIERTGRLILDPESDVTISTTPSYNYNLGGGPSSDFSNITINKLIEELEKGPVTITTSYQGEGGSTGSIIVKGDIDHTFNSPYPLIFHTKSADGILIEGSLTNVGNGLIELIAPKATIAGKLIGQNLKIEGDLLCLGELYGKNLSLLSEGTSEISGKLMTDGGTLSWKTCGDILLTGEWGHLGGGAFLLDGVQNFWVQEGALLYATNRTTELTIKNLSGSFSVEGGLVSLGCAPLLISGPLGSVSLEGGTIDSMAPITIDVGHHCHLHQSHITSQKPIHISLGSELLLMKGSTLNSPSGIRVNAKGDIALLDTSSLVGRGISISAGENLTLLDHGSIRGGSGPVSISTGKDMCLEGPHVQIEGGQVTLLPGEALTLEDRAQVSSTLGRLSISAGSSIRLDDQASIHAYGGDLDLVVTEGSLHLYGGSTISSTTHGSSIILGKSLIMDHFSQITSIGEQGTTIVVDHLGDNGGIAMGINASISTGHSPLKIFSSKRNLNTIEGTLNGYRYSPTLQYLSTNAEKWGTKYPSPLSNSPFTLFHKESGLIQIRKAQVTQVDFCSILAHYIGPFTAEMQRDLHPYDEFTSQDIFFTGGEEPYFIRRPALYPISDDQF